MDKYKTDNKIIFHLCTRKDWLAQELSANYIHPSLEAEGFIHCSTANQVDKVLKRYFQGVSDLVLLHIEVQAIESELKFELAKSDGDAYPHIFGGINKSAIAKIEILDNNKV